MIAFPVENMTWHVKQQFKQIQTVFAKFLLQSIEMRGKGRDLTQSYDKSPYTHRQIQKVTRQHKKTLHNDCVPT